MFIHRPIGGEFQPIEELVKWVALLLLALALLAVTASSVGGAMGLGVW